MSEPQFSPRTMTRLANLSAEVRDRLSPAEMATRLTWCAANNDDNLTVSFDGPDLVTVWGGAPLVVVPPDLMHRIETEDELTVGVTDLPVVPDDISGLDDLS